MSNTEPRSLRNALTITAESPTPATDAIEKIRSEAAALIEQLADGWMASIAEVERLRREGQKP